MEADTTPPAGATIGLPGVVIEQTTRKSLPKEFQTAEFVLAPISLIESCPVATTRNIRAALMHNGGRSQ